jgi:hypothetical protein
MSRLILEFFKDELSRIEGTAQSQNIRTFEILQRLKHDEEEITAICRVDPEDASAEFEDLVDSTHLGNGNLVEGQLLEKREEHT